MNENEIEISILQNPLEIIFYETRVLQKIFINSPESKV